MRGPHLDDAFAAQARPKQVPALERAAKANAQALPLDQLTDHAAQQLARVTAFLTTHTPTRATAVHLSKADDEWN
ncbi:hypothetical protein ABZT04_43720 [Streptomyces sp. NPDC005492]|uniref:hypothetical protein n=1 Tax=Streptomyces sp. NPDC005492 TaxID=3156883 RepID=UPI0033B12DD4